MARLSDVDLKLLRVFIGVVEAGGFSSAQGMLGLNASTISLYMSDLEIRLGYKLCQRGRSGFALTERGRNVYEQSTAILKIFDEFNGNLHSLRDRLSGRLMIGVVDANVVTDRGLILSETVKKFNELDNDVEIQLIIEPIDRLESMVLSGRIQAAIGPALHELEGLEYEHLFYEYQDLYTTRDNPAAAAVDKEDAIKRIRETRSIIRYYNQAYDLRMIKQDHANAVAYTMEAMATLLLSGGYVGFLPVEYAKHWIGRGMLTPVYEQAFRYRSSHALISKKPLSETTTLTTFLKILRAVAKARSEHATQAVNQAG